MKALILALGLIASFAAAAHSGGTDRNGCHTDHRTGTRHYH